MSKRTAGKVFLNPFKTITNDRSNFFDIKDFDETIISPDFLTDSRNLDPRNRVPILSKLAHQWIQQNESRLKRFDVSIRQEYDGNALYLRVSTGIKVGAFPLVSPVTGKNDHGIVIKPRYGWNGIGPTLSYVGWKCVPEILAIPMMKISEKSIPPWILSSVVLMRIESLIKELSVRFEFVSSEMNYPKGSVNWSDYSRNKIANAKFTTFSCRYPSLTTDRELKSYIHFALLKQLYSLQSQELFGYHVKSLVLLCKELIQKVRDIAPAQISTATLNKFYNSILKGSSYKEGIQAIDWTVNEKGLAGFGDLGGIPWIMSMEVLFESYVETIMHDFSKLYGGEIKTGRKRQTIVNILWENRYASSQNYLLPDVVYYKSAEETYVIDAKYKNHWEEVVLNNWRSVEEEIKDKHRADLLQVLAYSALLNTENVCTCLVYPCQMDNFKVLKDENKVISKAKIYHEGKLISLRLIAIPFTYDKAELISIFEQAFAVE